MALVAIQVLRNYESVDEANQVKVLKAADFLLTILEEFDDEEAVEYQDEEYLLQAVAFFVVMCARAEVPITSVAGPAVNNLLNVVDLYEGTAPTMQAVN